MNNLRIEKKDIYKINVNDNNEYIEFDLSDIGLSIRCVEALEKIDKIRTNATNQEKIIKKRQDVEGKYISRNQKDILYLWRKTFREMREAMDLFLGNGACQKIFGDSNYIEMFDDLIDELNKSREELNGKSHMQMLNITFDGMKKRIMDKYNRSNNKKVI